MYDKFGSGKEAGQGDVVTLARHQPVQRGIWNTRAHASQMFAALLLQDCVEGERCGRQKKLGIFGPPACLFAKKQGYSLHRENVQKDCLMAQCLQKRDAKVHKQPRCGITPLHV